MGDKLIESVTTIAVAIVGIAIIAVLVGSNARTSQVIQSAGSAFAQDVGAAVSPVTGGGGGLGTLGSYGGISGGASLPFNI